MIALLSAPSNLGLRPPEPGTVPGAAKAPEAYREAGLHRRFLHRGAADAGVVLPARYRDDLRVGEGRLRNQDGIIEHARRLSERLHGLLQARSAPLVLGGDCSLLIGAGLAVKRSGRFGLVHIDGHTDYRHPGNSAECGSLAGEDLAAAIGRHWPAVADIDGLGPYFDQAHTVHLGCRENDEHLEEVAAVLAEVVPARRIMEHGAGTAAALVRSTMAGAGLQGYWLHLDVDVLDQRYLDAVDSPEPGGLSPDRLTQLLSELAPGAIGAQVTVYDPDLDPDGAGARLLVEVLDEGLQHLGAAAF